MQELAQRGLFCTPEAGRGVIQDQMRIEGKALPWNDPLLFAELMLSWDMRSYHVAEQSTRPVIFDRGIPDVLGYLRSVGIPAPAYVSNAARTFPYNPIVFMAPPWPEIFRQDHERKQNFDEAVRTYESLAATYAGLNYRLVEIPRSSVSDRADFVLSQIKAADAAR